MSSCRSQQDPCFPKTHKLLEILNVVLDTKGYKFSNYFDFR